MATVPLKESSMIGQKRAIHPIGFGLKMELAWLAGGYARSLIKKTWMTQVLQILFSAALLTLSAWLSKKSPQAAGFLIALPLASIIVLPLSFWQHQDAAASIELGKEILKALPVSISFFIPFALANRFDLGFWQAYGLGLLALVLSYGIVKASIG